MNNFIHPHSPGRLCLSRSLFPVLPWGRLLAASAYLALSLCIVAAEPSTYADLKPDIFLRSWLVLQPIPASSSDHNEPTEEALKQAFAQDWLHGSGGETNVHPLSGMKQNVHGSELEWKPVNSKDDI